jgi:hypothetical protein
MRLAIRSSGLKKHQVAALQLPTGPPTRNSLSVSSSSTTSASPPDREPQTGHQEISTAPVTAVGFASINVEIRTELEKRVLCAL